MLMENNQETKQTWLENIAIILILGSFFLIQNFELFSILCVLFSSWQLWKHRKTVIKKFQWKWQFFVTSAVALFLAKIFAIHHFNGKYAIYPEYLNHSVTVWTIITASTFLILPILWDSLKFFEVARKEQAVLKSFKYAIYGITLIIACGVLSMGYFVASQHDKWLLILDAYSYSDCNPVQGSLAIRKDNQTCYQFISHGVMQWEMDEYPSPKP